MAENIVLTGFKKPWHNDPNFIVAMTMCNFNADKKNFTPNWKLNNAQPVKGKQIKNEGEK